MPTKRSNRDPRRRFLPDGQLDLCAPPASWIVPIPIPLLTRLRLPAVATPRDMTLLWLALAFEAELVRRGRPHERQSIEIRRLSPDILKRGGARAAVEICARLGKVKLEVGAAPIAPFDIYPALAVDGGSIAWRLSATIRHGLEEGFRLDRSRVARFARIELGVACTARSRWTMPLYAVISAMTILSRRNASDAGWIDLDLPIARLARRLGWLGYQQKDFIPKVLRPALTELGGYDTAPVSYPRYLRIEAVDDKDGTLNLRVRRLGRDGSPLDGHSLKGRLKAQRQGLTALPDSEPAQRPLEQDDSSGPLRQGFVF